MNGAQIGSIDRAWSPRFWPGVGLVLIAHAMLVIYPLAASPYQEVLPVTPAGLLIYFLCALLLTDTGALDGFADIEPDLKHAAFMIGGLFVAGPLLHAVWQELEAVSDQLYQSGGFIDQFFIPFTTVWRWCQGIVLLLMIYFCATSAGLLARYAYGILYPGSSDGEGLASPSPTPAAKVGIGVCLIGLLIVFTSMITGPFFDAYVFWQAPADAPWWQSGDTVLLLVKIFTAIVALGPLLAARWVWANRRSPRVVGLAAVVLYWSVMILVGTFIYPQPLFSFNMWFVFFQPVFIL